MNKNIVQILLAEVADDYKMLRRIKLSVLIADVAVVAVILVDLALCLIIAGGY